MENKKINLHIVAELAKALKELRERMVFVGGAVISLYTDDEAAEEIRPTADVDMTIQLAGFSDWVKMQERLAELKFSPDPNGHAICSYTYKGIAVDILPAEGSAVGETNSWYKPGFNSLKEVEIEDVKIRILSAPYFLATKFEAFHGRGNNEYRTSHDFEDIIYVIDNCTTIIDDIQNADKKVKIFIKDELQKVISHPYAQEIILSQVHPLMAYERIDLIYSKIKSIILD